MFSIPLFIFLVLYFLAIIVALVYFAFAIYHIVATGEFSLISFIVTSLVSVTIITILLSTWFWVEQKNFSWSKPFTFSSSPTFQDSGFVE